MYSDSWDARYDNFCVLVADAYISQITYIGRSLNNTAAEAWVPNACTLVQAVLAPILCSASDLFQIRKYILIGTGIVAFIGSAIAPGSYNIDRLIAAQALIGTGASSLPLVVVIPGEILPRKWRPCMMHSNLTNVGLYAYTIWCSGPSRKKRRIHHCCLCWPSCARRIHQRGGGKRLDELLRMYADAQKF